MKASGKKFKELLSEKNQEASNIVGDVEINSTNNYGDLELLSDIFVNRFMKGDFGFALKGTIKKNKEIFNGTQSGYIFGCYLIGQRHIAIRTDIKNKTDIFLDNIAKEAIELFHSLSTEPTEKNNHLDHRVFSLGIIEFSDAVKKKNLNLSAMNKSLTLHSKGLNCQLKTKEYIIANYHAIRTRRGLFVSQHRISGKDIFIVSSLSSVMTKVVLEKEVESAYQSMKSPRMSTLAGFMWSVQPNPPTSTVGFHGSKYDSNY